MMVTSYEIFAGTRHLFKPVPAEQRPNVCFLCLGAVASAYAQCYNCRKLFQESSCPQSLQRRVVPMTIAVNPSSWFWALQTYKTAQFREHGATLGALTHRWLSEHETDIRLLLGGPASYVTVVPSKKAAIAYENQPLRRALSLIAPLASRLRNVLRCTKPMSERLTTYSPQNFEAVDDVAGDRIVLVEDTWIRGATALSAAGALLSAGAASVVITPIARDVKPSFHGEDHPYLSYLTAEYDLTAWPRS